MRKAQIPYVGREIRRAVTRGSATSRRCFFAGIDRARSTSGARTVGAVKRDGSRPAYLAANRGASNSGTCLLPYAVHTVEGLSSAHLLDCEGEAAGRR